LTQTFWPPALFFNGVPGKILENWKSKQLSLVASPPILEEYQRVLRRLQVIYNFSKIDSFWNLFTSNILLVDAPPSPNFIKDDPDDDKFIACAIASEVKIIVSGDKHLLNISGIYGIEILRPSDFVKKYLQ
jgi:putative PIN family toxin of toxin-antitoxin system